MSRVESRDRLTWNGSIMAGKKEMRGRELGGGSRCIVCSSANKLDQRQEDTKGKRTLKIIPLCSGHCVTGNSPVSRHAAGLQFGFQIGAVLRPVCSPEIRNVIPNHLPLPHIHHSPRAQPDTGYHVSREISLGGRRPRNRSDHCSAQAREGRKASRQGGKTAPAGGGQQGSSDHTISQCWSSCQWGCRPTKEAKEVVK